MEVFSYKIFVNVYEANAWMLKVDREFKKKLMQIIWWYHLWNYRSDILFITRPLLRFQ